jgi:hypothetical protein
MFLSPYRFKRDESIPAETTQVAHQMSERPISLCIKFRHVVILQNFGIFLCLVTIDNSSHSGHTRRFHRGQAGQREVGYQGQSSGRHPQYIWSDVSLRPTKQIALQTRKFQQLRRLDCPGGQDSFFRYM